MGSVCDVAVYCAASIAFTSLPSRTFFFPSSSLSCWKPIALKYAREVGRRGAWNACRGSRGWLSTGISRVRRCVVDVTDAGCIAPRLPTRQGRRTSTQHATTARRPSARSRCTPSLHAPTTCPPPLSVSMKVFAWPRRPGVRKYTTYNVAALSLTLEP